MVILKRMIELNKIFTTSFVVFKLGLINALQVLPVAGGGGLTCVEGALPLEQRRSGRKGK